MDLVTSFKSSVNNLKSKIVVDWIIDRCLSSHDWEFGLLFDLWKIKGRSSVTIPDGKSLRATHVGQVRLGPDILLEHVLYVLECNCNLIYVAMMLEDLDCDILFSSNTYFIQDCTLRRPIGWGELQDGVYKLRRVGWWKAVLARKNKEDLWHLRLGKPSRQSLLSVRGISSNKSGNSSCDICIHAKQAWHPFPLRNKN